MAAVAPVTAIAPVTAVATAPTEAGVWNIRGGWGAWGSRAGKDVQVALSRRRGFEHSLL